MDRAASFFITEARTKGRGVVGDAVVGAHDVRQAAEVVVVSMCVEDARDLVHADAEGVQAVHDVRAGVDEVHLALEHQNARHGRTVGVPAVALARVQHGEVVAPDLVEAQHIRRPGLGMGRQVQVHAHGLAGVADLEDVGLEALDENAVADFLGLVLQHDEVQIFIHAPYFAKGELELQAHHLPWPCRRECRWR